MCLLLVELVVQLFWQCVQFALLCWLFLIVLFVFLLRHWNLCPFCQLPTLVLFRIVGGGMVLLYNLFVFILLFCLFVILYVFGTDVDCALWIWLFLISYFIGFICLVHLFWNLLLLRVFCLPIFMITYNLWLYLLVPIILVFLFFPTFISLLAMHFIGILVLNIIS